MGDLTESQILDLILPILRRSDSPDVELGPGDDSAVVRAPHGTFTVSTDVLVEGRHFRNEWSTGYDVGWRAAMQNLADAAAMGARPTALVVALVLPATTTLAWLADFARGVAGACERHGASVIGGDISSGDSIVVAVTVLGDNDGRPAVTRSGARAGDVIAVAGRLGWSAAGLAVCGRVLQVANENGPVPAQVRAVVDAYLRPEPAIAEGVSASTAHAMLDVSDGLVLDAQRMAEASGVSVDLADPLAASAYDAAILREVAAWWGVPEGDQPGLVSEWILSGGEDHAMVAAFAPDEVAEGFRPVGVVVESLAGSAGDVLVQGRRWERDSGWQHFAH
ncbi:thiamine-monophosphate kinase [Rarobacter faecitabidus]|uniref:Thiamine-monophosphate kinase n=1 Tax=Rarobacter faecitabidus TaxID=13243 RepID=A0A542ZUR1_RARFA|nr:thiamine-monophosphate kinase [Rarobacter faecitabidus]